GAELGAPLGSRLGLRLGTELGERLGAKLRMELGRSSVYCSDRDCERRWEKHLNQCLDMH
ncbi:hypothetical protein FRACYDRAFT_217366, partial [Fragilariopsis cylindrus CCMP1102]